MKQNHSTIVTDLSFGDQGKGTTVDYLARLGNVSAVIRYTGGSQPAHNVVTTDGRHHTFRQIGSGTFVEGVHTHLSRFVLLDPMELAAEVKLLSNLGCVDVITRLSVDEDVKVITPFHRDANFVREQSRGNQAHGTCGMGIGETMAMSLARPDITVYAKDLKEKATLTRKFRLIREYFESSLFSQTSYKELLPEEGVTGNRPWFGGVKPEVWADLYYEVGKHLNIVSGTYLHKLSLEGNLIFEGAQGVLLDEWYGFHPHTTWGTTTPANAETLLREIGYSGTIEKLGVLRAYQTRHGAGPFVTEDTELTQLLPDTHNENHGWQGLFRVGWFDLVMARYALLVSGGVDSLVITNIDRFLATEKKKICNAYLFHQGDVSPLEKAMLLDVSAQGKFLTAYGLKKKGVLTDLSYQENLTGLLNKAIPSYTSFDGSMQAYLECIESVLSIPISITSHGPTALDKRIKNK